jgi:hypothetical protein
MKQFDERQLQIRGQIFFHGLMVIFALVLINGFLQDNMIAWASGFNQSLLIIIATVMAVSIEAILRGAFFGRRQTHWPMVGIYGACAAVIIIFYAVRFLNGAAFLDAGGLSDYGANFATGLMLAITTIIGVCKEISERHVKSE